MTWQIPAIVEDVCMNSEIGAYQEDDGERPGDSPIASVVDPSASGDRGSEAESR